MKQIITLCLALVVASALMSQVLTEKQQIQDINLRMNTAGKSLKHAAAMQTGAIITSIAGAGIASIGAFTSSQPIMIAGGVVSLISVPFVIGSVAHLNYAGKTMINTKAKLADLEPKELEDLRAKNAAYLKEQKEKEKAAKKNKK